MEARALRQRGAGLEEKVRRLQRIYELSPIAFLSLNDAGQIREMNKAARALISPRGKLRLAAPMSEFMAESSLARFSDHLRRCRAAHSRAVRTELNLATQTGEILPVQLISTALFKGTRFETVMIDLRPHRTGEEALTRACLYAEQVVQTMPHPVINLDERGHVTNANDAFFRCFQTDVRRVINLPFDGLEGIHWETPGLREKLRGALRRGEPLDAHLVKASLASGSVLALALAARRVSGTHGFPPGMLVAFEDITRRHRADEERDRLFQELQEERAKLEARVRERTEELAESNRQLREMSERLLAAQEDEQRRIARELHDEIGQGLTALRILLSRGAKGAEEPVDILRESLNATEEIVKNVRALCGSLRPQMLDDLGLLPAIRWHIQTFGERTGIKVKFSERGIDETQIPPATRSTIFRVVQEGLTNVARHSRAKQAAVALRQDRASIALEIADKGRGFNLNEVSASSNGLSGIRERIALAKGSCEITSAPGAGTKILIQLPVSPTPAQTNSGIYDQDYSSGRPQPRPARP